MYGVFSWSEMGCIFSFANNNNNKRTNVKVEWKAMRDQIKNNKRSLSVLIQACLPVFGSLVV